MASGARVSSPSNVRSIQVRAHKRERKPRPLRSPCKRTRNHRRLLPMSMSMWPCAFRSLVLPSTNSDSSQQSAAAPSSQVAHGDGHAIIRHVWALRTPMLPSGASQIDRCTTPPASVRVSSTISQQSRASGTVIYTRGSDGLRGQICDRLLDCFRIILLLHLGYYIRCRLEGGGWVLDGLAGLIASHVGRHLAT